MGYRKIPRRVPDLVSESLRGRQDGGVGTTNYVETFIRVAEDCPATIGTMPPSGAWPTVARLQYDLLAEHPYELTSDDVLFRVHATRAGIPEEEQAQARAEFFSKSQACLRSSPLGKRYGWGLHHDADGRRACR